MRATVTKYGGQWQGELRMLSPAMSAVMALKSLPYQGSQYCLVHVPGREGLDSRAGRGGEFGAVPSLGSVAPVEVIFQGQHSSAREGTGGKDEGVKMRTGTLARGSPGVAQSM